MNPSDAHSPINTLRQLKEMLDAGTLTPAEFEALKQQLIFGKEGTGPVETPVPPMPLVPAAAAPAADLLSPTDFLEPAPEPPPAETLLPTPTPPAAADWLAAPAPMLLSAETPSDPEAERRNPLTWVFAVGGALVLLAIVLYLALGNQPDSEHLTSASQTAADSTAVAPEVGPQAEQITLPPTTAPETIRVAPATPPIAPAAATKFRADSVAAPISAPPAPVKVTPVAPPVAADSAAASKL
ncbi:hypothetical protein GO988_10455 [Hymenobacter sp. HMF4947]|uniref:SHOCT domain-containing protein n=1 Tax=Hymenobacter ginkgonis TaxID=2682976 RepID=A0A7K1TEM3_9BACT|nr:SHOCT domain-containing protein [Hymenobacter ginkgonis]MVN76742.1 hypothetical protein [Hymenobacter ginkgonis]